MKTVKDIVAQKSKQERITMLTAYDYSMASLLDEAGIDIILVGGLPCERGLGAQVDDRSGDERNAASHQGCGAGGQERFGRQ